MSCTYQRVIQSYFLPVDVEVLVVACDAACVHIHAACAQCDILCLKVPPAGRRRIGVVTEELSP